MEHILQYHSKRTHSTAREHILYQENTFYTNGTHSTVSLGDMIVREHILYQEVVREHILYHQVI